MDARGIVLCQPLLHFDESTNFPQVCNALWKLRSRKESFVNGRATTFTCNVQTLKNRQTKSNDSGQIIATWPPKGS